MSAKRAKSVKLRLKGRRTIHEDNIIKKQWYEYRRNQMHIV